MTRPDIEDFEREISSRERAAARSEAESSSQPAGPVQGPVLHPREVEPAEWEAALKAALHPEVGGWEAAGTYLTDRCRVEARRYREGQVEILTSPAMRGHRATTVALSLVRRGWSVTLRPS